MFGLDDVSHPDGEQTGQRAPPAIAPAPQAVCPGAGGHRPRQVYSWDITKLAGPAKGIYYDAYVMIDIFFATSSGYTSTPASAVLATG